MVDILDGMISILSYIINILIYVIVAMLIGSVLIRFYDFCAEKNR